MVKLGNRNNIALKITAGNLVLCPILKENQKHVSKPWVLVRAVGSILDEMTMKSHIVSEIYINASNIKLY